MKPNEQFERQLRNFENEATTVARYLYAEMAIHHAASRSEPLLHRLNMAPTFWNVCLAALQSGAYMAIARVFDKSSAYNLDALLRSMEANLDVFSRASLAERKRNGKKTDPDWLEDYLTRAYYPTIRDVQRIRSTCSRHRAVYERAIQPVRHQYLGHRVKIDHADIQALYAAGRVDELWKLSTFLIKLNTALWELLHNGRRPVLHASRFSVKAIYKAKVQRSQPHESIVGEVTKFMRFIETATPNPSLERTSTGMALGPRGAKH